MVKKDKYSNRETFPRFFKADFTLQNKIGTGTLDAEAVAKVQQYLDGVDTDVSADIRDSLAKIQSGLSAARSVSYGREEFLPQVIKPLMDIKALSGTFHEMMICRVSSFVLTFLEDVRAFDNDVVDIIDAYIKVVKVLMELKIKDETNPNGQSFLSEIRNACKRYYDKRTTATRG